MRSKWKHLYINQNILQKFKNLDNVIPLKLWDRRATISEQCYGKTFNIHNGTTHIPIKITQDHIGHKFGEFAMTRKLCVFKKKTKKKKS
jgi:small subunit ribosomal protein S19